MTSRGRTRSSGARRRARRAIASACCALALVAGLAGCGDKAPSPAQVRRDARKQLVAHGATTAQARCLTDHLSDAQLTTLSKGGTIDRSSKGFQAYSDALVACSSSK